MSAACTDGSVTIYSGGELLTLERYFEKGKMKCTNVFSDKRISLETTRTRQRNLLTQFDSDGNQHALDRNVTTLVVGDSKDIRTDNNNEPENWGDSGNQKFALLALHADHGPTEIPRRHGGYHRSYHRPCLQLARLACCGRRNKKNRKYGGLYACDTCGAVVHAAINGAVNIMKRDLPG